MTFLLLSILLVAATLWVARPVLAGGNLRPGFENVDGRGVLGTFAAVSAAALVLGIDFAVGLLVAALIKSAGHLVGQRLAGDEAAEFRLVPFPGGPEAAGDTPRNDLGAFFILLMGPGLGLAPMVAAFALFHVFADTAPHLAEALTASGL